MKSQNIPTSVKLSMFDDFKNGCDEHGIIFPDRDIELLKAEFSRYVEECQSNLINAIHKRAEIKENRKNNVEKNLTKHCNVPKRYLQAKKHDISEGLLKGFNEFITGKVEGLFLFGATGTGKTHLAIALMREYILSAEIDIVFQYPDRFHLQPYLRPYFKSVPDLLSEIRNTFNDENKFSEKQITEKYTGDGREDHNYSFLVLDDLGAEKTTEWVEQTLYTIIDHRYRNMKRTIVTSNLTLDEISAKFNDRIASRIAEMCKVVELKGVDRRTIKNI